MKRKIYALYKGDDFVDVGTAEELAQRQNVKKKTIYYLSKKSYKKRIKKRIRSNNALIAIKIED